MRPTMRLRRSDILSLLVALFAVQMCRTTVVAATDEEQAAREWLETFYPQAEERCFAFTSAYWNFNVNISAENLQRLIAESKRKTEFLQETYANVSQFNWKTFTDKNLTRQLAFISDIGISVLPVYEALQADQLRSDMQTVYSTARVCNRPSDVGTEDADKCYNLSPDLERIMAKSRDWEELVWAWREWRRETGRKMKSNYSDFVDLHNKAARLNGFADNGEYWRSYFETDDFKESVEQLWRQVRPLYQQLHAYVRRKLIDAYAQHRDDFPESGHIPAHIFGNMWAQEWTNIFPLLIPFPNRSSPNVTRELVEQGYNATAMFQLADEFFTSISLEPVPPLFWENSILKKPDDGREIVCHASAWDFCNGKDFRIKQCTDVTNEYLRTTHHEMGHIQYFIMYRYLPLSYRQGANPGFHEAVGDVISLSVDTPEHLQQIGLMKDFSDNKEADLNYLMKQALEKIAFLPFGYLIDKWRWSVFEGTTTSETYNVDWWKLRCSLQGISPPVARTSEDFDPGSKFHVPNNVPYIRYFVSFVIQFQFHKALCQAANMSTHRPLHRCDIYQSQEAGDLLRRMLELGSSKPWPDAMEVITGQRNMDAGPLLEYFQPLHDWLRQQNAGHKVTWDDSCPPGSFAGSSDRNVGFRLVGAHMCAIFMRALVYATAMLAGVLLRVSG